VRKTITVDDRNERLLIDYSLRNYEAQPVPVWFGVEFNVGLQAGDAPDRYYYRDDSPMDDARLRSMGEIQNVSALGLRDEWLGVDVRIEIDRPTTMWRFPIEVVSLSEEGFERIFQSSVVIPHWQFVLEKEWTLRLSHTIQALPHHGR
jgi:alpha-amylase